MFWSWLTRWTRRAPYEGIIGFEQLERRTAPSGMFDVFAGSALASMPDVLVPPTLDRAPPADYAADLPADEQFIARQRTSRHSNDSNALLSSADADRASDSAHWYPPDEAAENEHRKRIVAAMLSGNAWPTRHQPPASTNHRTPTNVNWIVSPWPSLSSSPGCSLSTGGPILQTITRKTRQELGEEYNQFFTQANMPDPQEHRNESLNVMYGGIVPASADGAFRVAPEDIDTLRRRIASP